MASKYFTTKIKPDIINGDVSNVIQDDKTDLPFSASDILFDWQEMQVPKGTKKLVNVTAYMFGEGGGAQAAKDFYLIFAKSVDGVAPSSLGSVNAAQTACFELPLHYVGGLKVEASAAAVGMLLGPAFGSAYVSNAGGSGRVDLPIVLEGEPASGTNVGFDSIYVAGFAGGAFDFSTGVLKDGAETSNSATSLTTKTVDPRKSFSVGDTVYIHDVDTAIGTVASMTATNITLNAAIASGTDIADEDEFMNATPITLVFGFEQ